MTCKLLVLVFLSSAVSLHPGYQVVVKRGVAD
jgi:hypothetical protein